MRKVKAIAVGSIGRRGKSDRYRANARGQRQGQHREAAIVGVDDWGSCGLALKKAGFRAGSGESPEAIRAGIERGRSMKVWRCVRGRQAIELSGAYDQRNLEALARLSTCVAGT